MRLVIAWAVMNVALVLGSTFWIETLLARSIRLRRALAKRRARRRPPGRKAVPRQLRRLTFLGVRFAHRLAILAVLLRDLRGDDDRPRNQRQRPRYTGPDPGHPSRNVLRGPPDRVLRTVQTALTGRPLRAPWPRQLLSVLGFVLAVLVFLPPVAGAA